MKKNLLLASSLLVSATVSAEDIKLELKRLSKMKLTHGTFELQQSYRSQFLVLPSLLDCIQ